MDKFYGMVYIKPWSRIGPYAVGILLGYLLFREGQTSSQPFKKVCLPVTFVVNVYANKMSRNSTLSEENIVSVCFPDTHIILFTGCIFP